VVNFSRSSQVGHVADVGEKRIQCRFLVGKLEEKENIWGDRCRWKNNIKEMSQKQY
jgi:hypothetical protein